MIKIDNQTKEFIQENKELLSSSSIFNLVRDEIDFLLQHNVKISDIHKILEKELEIEINIISLYSYLRRNKKINKRIVKDTRVAKDKNKKILGII